MIKKVKVEQLQTGMFIHDLNCGWLHHPFMKSRMKISDTGLIDRIAEYGIREVYIDTDRGLDAADAPTEEEVNEEMQMAINTAAGSDMENAGQVTLKEELTRAKEIKKEATRTIRQIMEDARFGKNIEETMVREIVEKMTDSIFRNKDALLSLGRIKKTDEYTYTHSVSVCVLMLAFGKHLGFDAQLLRDLGTGAMLHDIGKVKVPLEILNKEGILSEDEFEEVKAHVKHGCNMLEETAGISDTSILVSGQHHERMDGTGYPEGLKGDEISVYGQVAAIIDVYDAMISDRCYKFKLPPTKVLGKLFEWSRFYFNRSLVEKFVRCIGVYPVGSLVYMESGMLGVVICHGTKSLLQPVVRIVFNTNTRKYVRPFDIDLSQPQDKGYEDKILNYASQDEWNINPEIYY